LGQQESNQGRIGAGLNVPLSSTYSASDRLQEGSGAGPLRGDRYQKQKYDDTEDSEDDDDDDYEDYKESLDNGSGYPNKAEKPVFHSSQTPSSEVAKPKNQNDPNIYHPFRPLASPPRAQPTSTTEHTQRLFNSIALVTEPSTVRATQRITEKPIPSTPVPPTTMIHITRPAISPAPPNQTSMSTKNNGTKLDSDYDYEEENEEENSEEFGEGSVFEDNDPNEFDAQSNKTSTMNSLNNTLGSTIAHNTTGVLESLPNHGYSREPQSNSTSNYYNHDKNLAKVKPLPSLETIHSNRPSITTPSTVLVSNPGGPQTNDQNEDDKTDIDEEADDDEDEDEEDEEDDTRNNPNVSTYGPHINKARVEGDLWSNLPSTNNTQLHDRLDKFNISLPVYTQTSPPDVVTSPAKQPSQSNDKPIHGLTFPTTPVAIFSTTPVPYFINSGLGTSFPKPIVEQSSGSTVRYITSTTTSPIFTPPPRTDSAAKVQNSIIRQSFPPTSTTRFPNLIPVFPSTTLTSILNRYNHDTTPVQRYNPSQPTMTSILPYDREVLMPNDDSLTRQIYDKAIEVYHETGKTLRQAWETVWSANMNFEPSKLELLFSDPLFLMCKLNYFYHKLIPWLSDYHITNLIKLKITLPLNSCNRRCGYGICFVHDASRLCLFVLSTAEG